MNKDQKKQLVQEYRLRKPEKGLVSLRCKATGEEFLAMSNDTKADINGTTFKLTMGGHPNRELQALWSAHGEQGFEVGVVRVLDYDDPAENHTRKLEALRDEYLAEHPDAKSVWRS